MGCIVACLSAQGLRLALICGQALFYCANENVLTDLTRVRLFWDLFSPHAAQFDSTYAATVASHRQFLEKKFAPAAAES